MNSKKQLIQALLAALGEDDPDRSSTTASLSAPPSKEPAKTPRRKYVVKDESKVQAARDKTRISQMLTRVRRAQESTFGYLSTLDEMEEDLKKNAPELYREFASKLETIRDGRDRLRDFFAGTLTKPSSSTLRQHDYPDPSQHSDHTDGALSGHNVQARESLSRSTVVSSERSDSQRADVDSSPQVSAPSGAPPHASGLPNPEPVDSERSITAHTNGEGHFTRSTDPPRSGMDIEDSSSSLPMEPSSDAKQRILPTATPTALLQPPHASGKPDLTPLLSIKPIVSHPASAVQNQRVQPAAPSGDGDFNAKRRAADRYGFEPGGVVAAHPNPPPSTPAPVGSVSPYAKFRKYWGAR